MRNKLLPIEYATEDAEIKLFINERSSPFKVEFQLLLKEMEDLFFRLTDREDSIKLHTLSLNNLNMTVEMLKQLIGAGLDAYSINSLVLSNNQLQDDVMELLLKFKDAACFSNLKHLDLSGNKITANGLAKLAAFCDAVGVESLVLSKNPILSTSACEVLFKTWADNFYYHMPAIKTLDIQEIGLKYREELLYLLLNNPSMMKEINIGNVLATSIDKVLNSPGFLSNMGLKVSGRISQSSAMKKIINNKKRTLLSLKKVGFKSDIHDRPFVCDILSWLMKNDERELPVNFSQWLNATSGESALSLRDKLVFFTRELQYFRDLAKLENPELVLPDVVSEQEYLAMLNHDLTNFWSIGQHRHRGDANVPGTQMYVSSIKPVVKALPLFQHENKPFYVLLDEDDSLRIIYAKKQFILSRYEQAFMCGKDAHRSLIIDDVKVLFNRKAEIHLIQNNNHLGSVRGSVTGFLREEGFKQFNFEGYETVDSLHLLSRSDIESPAPTHTPQFRRVLSEKQGTSPGAANSSPSTEKQSKKIA